MRDGWWRWVRERTRSRLAEFEYDVRAVGENVMARRIQSLLWKARLLVAGSTLPGEEEMLLRIWPSVARSCPRCGFIDCASSSRTLRRGEGFVENKSPWVVSCKALLKDTEPIFGGVVVLLDTVGDLASIYGIAELAFVGGSLLPKGGHNPLEPAQFGVPIVMGPSYENFRAIVEEMREANAISILGATAAGPSTAAAKNAAYGRDDKLVLKNELEAELVRLLTDREAAKAMGERGRRVFEEQQGASKRAVEAIVAMVNV